MFQLPTSCVRIWSEDSLTFKTKQAEELVYQIYSTYNYIMLFQSQISSIWDLQPFSDWKYD